MEKMIIWVLIIHSAWVGVGVRVWIRVRIETNLELEKPEFNT